MRKTRFNNRLTTARTQQAYKGYLLTTSPFNGTVAISKDGFHISYAKSLETAKSIVDQLV